MRFSSTGRSAGKSARRPHRGPSRRGRRSSLRSNGTLALTRPQGQGGCWSHVHHRGPCPSCGDHRESAPSLRARRPAGAGADEGAPSALRGLGSGAAGTCASSPLDWPAACGHPSDAGRRIGRSSRVGARGWTAPSRRSAYSTHDPTKPTLSTPSSASARGNGLSGGGLPLGWSERQTAWVSRN